MPKICHTVQGLTPPHSTQHLVFLKYFYFSYFLLFDVSVYYSTAVLAIMYIAWTIIWSLIFPYFFVIGILFFGDFSEVSSW